jgi:hypothetical protein
MKKRQKHIKTGYNRRRNAEKRYQRYLNSPFGNFLAAKRSERSMSRVFRDSVWSFDHEEATEAHQDGLQPQA